MLSKHFPETKLFTDIKDVTGEQLRATGFIPDRGIITAGFPCQDLSVAGLRKGLAGSRSGLFWEIIRLVDETQPRYLIIENVAGLLSSQSGTDLGIVIEALVERRYGIAWRVLDSQHFGVPQRRRRVFIVASFGEHRSPVQILFEPESRTGHLEPSKKKKQNFARLSTSGVNGNSSVDTQLFDATRNADVRFYDQSPTMKARWGTGGNNVPMLALPIQDGRDIEKKQNGLGVGVTDAPSYTLDATGAQAVAFVPRVATMQGIGDYADTGVASTMKQRDYKDATDLVVTQPVAYDEFNDSISHTHQTLRAGTKQSTGVITFQQPVAFDTYNQTVSNQNQTLSSAASDSSHYGTVFVPNNHPDVLMRNREGKPGGGERSTDE